MRFFILPPLTAICVLFGGVCFAQGSGAAQPNIIYILADDLGKECLGSYGGTSYRTPVLDQMAKRGMRFTRAYSLPSCTPTRNKTLTGRSNVRNYVFFSYLDPNEIVFPELLQAQGYETCAAGKWQLCGNPTFPEFTGGKHPNQSGFDEWFLWQVTTAGARYWDPTFESHNLPATTYAGSYGPDLVNDFVLDFIERNKNGPFLVYYPMLLAHTPFEKPPNYSGTTNSGREIFPYMVAYMDFLVGKVFAKLKALGLLENTLVIFAGDNGTFPDVISEWPGVVPGGIVHGTKGVPAEGGLRMPMIAYWKGTILPGSVNQELVDFSDIFPTFLEMAGAPLPNDRIIDGVSILGQLNGSTYKPRESIFGWFWPMPSRNAPPLRRWIVTKDWKLYTNKELYNIALDPFEGTNLYGSTDPASVSAQAELQQLLDGYPMKSPFWGG